MPTPFQCAARTAATSAARSLPIAVAILIVLAACATPPEPVSDPRRDAAPAQTPPPTDTSSAEAETAPEDAAAAERDGQADEATATTSEPDRGSTADAPGSEPAVAQQNTAPSEPQPSAPPEQATAPTPEREPAPTNTEPVASRPEPEPAPAEPELPSEAEPEPATPSQALNRRIAGNIEVLRNGRELGFTATYLEQTIVAWRPENTEPAAPMEPQQIVTRSSRFFPQTMVVTSGTRVRFPNLDDIRHNVFSLTPSHRFDVGVYGPDEGAATVFDGVGTVEIFCNIHPNMAAFMLVLDTTHFTSPDQEGRFELEGLPPGPGELLVWNYRAEERIVRRRLADSNRLGDEISMTIDITRPSVPQHTTKEGRPYHLPES